MFLRSKIVSQKGCIRNSCHNQLCNRNWYFKLSVACTNYGSCYYYIITFTEWKQKSRKFSKSANVIQIVSERTIIQSKSVWGQTSIFSPLTVSWTIPYMYGYAYSFPALGTNVVWFAFKQTFDQLSWSVYALNYSSQPVVIFLPVCSRWLHGFWNSPLPSQWEPMEMSTRTPVLIGCKEAVMIFPNVLSSCFPSPHTRTSYLHGP